MFVLVLNDMRSAQVEDSVMVCRSETEGAINELLKRESVETYKDPKGTPYWLESPRSGGAIYIEPTIEDGWWGKTFRKGGPLEWYNQPSPWHGQGIRDPEVLARESGCNYREEIENFIERIWFLPDAARM